MEKVQIIALILLLGRIVAISFISSVLRKQWKLFKFKVESGLNSFRKVMFAFSVVLFISNLAPIVIDVAALIDVYPKSSGSPTILGLIYTFSNMTTSVMSAFFIWTIYNIAARTTNDNDIMSHDK